MSITANIFLHESGLKKFAAGVALYNEKRFRINVVYTPTKFSTAFVNAEITAVSADDLYYLGSYTEMATVNSNS